MIEAIVIIFITVFVLVSRFGKNDSVVSSTKNFFGKIFSKFVPYNYQDVKRVSKEMGQSFNSKQYAFQFVMFAVGGGAVAFLYFRSLTWAIIYGIIATAFVPYINILSYKRIYSEYIFECIQTYCTNVIMEFNTTQSFLIAIEGVI